MAVYTKQNGQLIEVSYPDKNHAKDWGLDLGIIIPANSDLNDYTTSGNYRGPNLSPNLTSTLSNMPITGIGAFVLKVYLVSDTLLLQEMIDNYGVKYIRRATYASNQWTFESWVYMHNVVSSTLTANDVANVALTKGSLVHWRGKFYKVIASVAVGDQFVVGTNLQQTTVGKEITDITTNVLSAGTNYARYTKQSGSGRKFLLTQEYDPTNDYHILSTGQYGTSGTLDSLESRIYLRLASDYFMINTLLTDGTQRSLYLPRSGDLRSLCKVVTYKNSAAVTVNANGNAQLTMATSEDTTGYVYLAVANFYTGSWGCAASTVGQGQLRVANVTNSAITIAKESAYINAIYIKTGFRVD